MSKRAKLAVFFSFALGAGQVQAAAPPQFDLFCKGSRGAQLHFRFDLAQRKWCIGQCQSVWSINELSDSSIKVLTYSCDSKYNWTFLIDRYTTAFSAVHRGYGDSPADGGTCETKPFSGFPNRKF